MATIVSASSLIPHSSTPPLPPSILGGGSIGVSKDLLSSSGGGTIPLLFYYQPLFHPLFLPDTSPIEDAVNYILLLRKKSINPNLAQLSESIKLALGGGKTIADLRRLTDQEWRTLDAPAMCKIYLKHLVRSSQPNKTTGNKRSNAVPLSTVPRAPSPQPSTNHLLTSATPPPPPPPPNLPPYLLQLSSDFNNGIPLDLSIYSVHLSTLKQIGFEEKDALEALLITDNKGPELALEILLADPLVKKQKREDAIKRRSMNHNNYSHSNGAAQSKAESEAYRMQIEMERGRAERAEKELALHIANLPRTVYKEFIRGLIADREISIEEYEQLRSMRDKKKITTKEHGEILRELGVTAEEFEKMKKFDAKAKVDFDCVICLDKPKSVLIFPCMHVCLCDSCEKNINGKKDAKCPICQKTVVKTQKIFFS